MWAERRDDTLLTFYEYSWTQTLAMSDQICNNPRYMKAKSHYNSLIDL
jgi:hypothetical protein